MSTLNEKQQAVLRKAAAAIKDRGHVDDARLADSVLGVIQSLAATKAPSAPVAPQLLENIEQLDERAAFEAAAGTHSEYWFDVRRDPDGAYMSPVTRQAWAMWQARAALSVKADRLAAEWGIAQIEIAQARQLEAAMIERRIAITPEYDGGFNADIYEGEESPVAKGYGKTPSEAVQAAMLAAAPTPPTRSTAVMGDSIMRYNKPTTGEA